MPVHRGLKIRKDDEQGELKAAEPGEGNHQIETRIKLGTSTGPGDQTVLLRSAEHQLSKGKLKGVFCQTGYEHQACSQFNIVLRSEDCAEDVVDIINLSPSPRIISLVIAITLSELPNSGMAEGGSGMKPAENRIAELFKSTKTICVGRILLDVPADADVIYGPARLPYLIARRPNAGEELDVAVADRLKEIMEDDLPRIRGPLKKQDSMFGKIVNGAAADQRIVFGAGKSEGSFYSIESFQRVGADLYVQRTTAYGDDYRQVVGQLNLIGKRIRHRADEESPNDPGICLEGAFIGEPSTPVYEAVALGVRLHQFPDVHFSLETIKKDRKTEADSLEYRIAEAARVTKAAGASDWQRRVRVFRQGERKVDNWSGYEYLAWKPEIGEVNSSHEFAYFSHGEPGNALRPTLDIALDTGVKGNKASATESSITDEEALYFWDKILSSIRSRPIQKAVTK